MNKKTTKISNFEDDLKKLQSILDDIESDKLTLEDSIQKYKEGMELSKKCQEALDEAKQVIKLLEDEK
ncbi:MAG: exodeoxyribonuclease VII small subunit [Gammaproteobacteria bacterium]|jgi:exodeoxyribonuclease VII small subunit|nr:exodeoxyribonuclease VII small subunit [Gammaproteobacteria bacterium]MBL6819584.1 exodeoxyribonuclease VII small subunit [Gammaproteobacteria bacterium]MBL6899123.1 exodeoxyribonuclease VII small subunit [Gammaproteobacteria bacterium]